MAKKRHATTPQAQPQVGPMIPLGPTTPVDVKSVLEDWSEYKLEDGTLLQVKPMIADVQRVTGKFNEQGEPLYLVTAAIVIRTKAPKRLRKKGK